MIFQRILNRIFPASSFGRNVGLLAGGTFVGQIVGLVAVPIITRLYTPADFGVVGVFASVIAVLQIFTAFAYHRAVPLPKSDSEGLIIIVLSALCLVGMVALLSVVLIVFGSGFLGWLNCPELLPYSWLIPVAVFFGGSYEIASAWTIRQKHFGVLSRTKIHQATGMAATQIGLGLGGVGLFGLIMGDILGRSLGTLNLLLPIYREHKQDVVQIQGVQLRSSLKKYRGFPLFHVPFMLLSQAGLYLPTMLIAALYDPAAGGIFLLAYRVLHYPLAVIGRSVARVYLAEAAEAVRDEPERLRPLFQSTFWQLFLIGIAPLGILALTGPLLFGLIFGEAWSEAGRYAQWLALPVLLQFAIAPLIQTLLVMERQDLSLLWAFIKALLTGSSFVIVYALGGSIAWAAISYSAALAVSYLAGYGLLTLCVPHGPKSEPRQDSTGARIPAPNFVKNQFRERHSSGRV